MRIEPLREFKCRSSSATCFTGNALWSLAGYVVCIYLGSRQSTIYTRQPAASSGISAASLRGSLRDLSIYVPARIETTQGTACLLPLLRIHFPRPLWMWKPHKRGPAEVVWPAEAWRCVTGRFDSAGRMGRGQADYGASYA